MRGTSGGTAAGCSSDRLIQGVRARLAFFCPSGYAVGDDSLNEGRARVVLAKLGGGLLSAVACDEDGHCRGWATELEVDRVSTRPGLVLGD